MMNVYQLRDNLKNTIKNKRELLVAMSDKSSEDLVAQFLKINIDELERILVDVEICCEQSNRVIIHLERILTRIQNDVEQSNRESWISNPERMGQ